MRVGQNLRSLPQTSIPKGLRLKAQGCRVGEATLGHREEFLPTPTGLWNLIPGADLNCPVLMNEDESHHTFFHGLGRRQFRAIAHATRARNSDVGQRRAGRRRPGNHCGKTDATLGASAELVERLSSHARAQYWIRARSDDSGRDFFRAKVCDRVAGLHQLPSASPRRPRGRARAGWRSVADFVFAPVFESLATGMVGTMGAQCLAEFFDHRSVDRGVSRARETTWFFAAGNLFPAGGCNRCRHFAESFPTQKGNLIFVRSREPDHSRTPRRWQTVGRRRKPPPVIFSRVKRGILTTPKVSRLSAQGWPSPRSLPWVQSYSTHPFRA